MKAETPASGNRSPRPRWRRLAAATVGLAAVLFLGSVWLFTGTEVACAEIAPGGDHPGPQLRCAFQVAADPETVWRAFAGTGEPRPYYFDAVLEAEMRPGGRWRFVTDDRQHLLAGGEILAIEPPRRFEHTFRAADLDEAPSRVTVTLEEIPAGCRVVLTHDRFPSKTATYRRFRRAHPLALSALKAFLERGELPLRARLYTALFKPGMKTVTAQAEPWD